MEQKDRRFNPFRSARTEPSQKMVRDAVAKVQDFEARTRARIRARKAADQRTFERQIEAILCDAALLSLEQPDGWLTVSRSKEHLSRVDRYSSPVMSKTLPPLLDRLAEPELDLIEIQPGYVNPFNGVRAQTIFRLSASIRQKTGFLSPEDFNLHEEQEVIILKAGKQSVFDGGEYMQYQDTPQTVQHREDLRKLNRWLEDADINVPEPPSGPLNRRLRRFFNNGSFTLGGRLFGGFWMDMSRQQRKSITIDGYPLVTLDYSQMGPRILYSMAKAPLPPVDAYAVPGLERYREGVKKLFGAMVHASSPITRFPKGTKDLFGNGISAKVAVQAITEFHAPIAHLFHSGQGMSEMFHESEVLMDVLLRLMGMEIVALPIHDAVMVRYDLESETRTVMLEVFKNRTGIDGLITVDD